MRKKHADRILVLLFACVMAICSITPAFADTDNYGPAAVVSRTGPGGETGKSTTTDTIKGESLGMFSTTGYCNCEQCSGGNNLTYAGTVPQEKHTISADLTRLPLGTRVMIGDTIYTVEDIGSKVTGNVVDIFYATHEDALAHGRQEQEVFAVNDIVMVAKLNK